MADAKRVSEMLKPQPAQFIGWARGYFDKGIRAGCDFELELAAAGKDCSLYLDRLVMPDGQFIDEGKSISLDATTQKVTLALPKGASTCEEVIKMKQAEFTAWNTHHEGLLKVVLWPLPDAEEQDWVFVRPISTGLIEEAVIEAPLLKLHYAAELGKGLTNYLLINSEPVKGAVSLEITCDAREAVRAQLCWNLGI